MQLSKLEIKGFKSFGDKIVINFDEGITGIVGPNGCGKSNVVDAIRWVLGEQKTRILRSDKMENIIFNGTKHRKPTQLAEVSLTFLNTKNILPTEYTEVTITRRYYRSGDSEYMLNGVVCRLKDITNLFLDTGIASSSYAIIELKMVDNILNDKENSRRALIEEAAGISKFKKRIKETQRKLDYTDADLERVEDLIFEIEKNLRSLEKQATQAEKYFNLKKDHKELSISFAKKAVDIQRNEFQRLDTKIATEQDLKVSLATQLSELDALIEEGKKDLVIKEKDLGIQQKTLNAHVGQIRSYESEKKVKNERQKFFQDKSEKLSEQIQSDKASNNRAHHSIKSLQNEKEELEKILAAKQVELDELQKKRDDQKGVTTEIENVSFELSQQLKNIGRDVNQQIKDLEVKTIQISTLKSELENSSTDSSQSNENLKDFDLNIDKLSAEMEAERSVLKKIEVEELDNQAAMEQVQEDLETIKQDRVNKNRELDALKNEYQLTKSLVDNLEGFPEAIRFLKKNSKWIKDAPLLSDILTCDETYRVTIENYLEPFMNYYIVDRAEHANKAVNILQEASRGKAKFFILDEIPGVESKSVTPNSDYIKALDIVEYDAKYEALLSYLLDRVYISKDALADIKITGSEVVISENGHYARKNFTIAGGAVGLFEGKRIGRAKNLEKLAKKIAKLESSEATFGSKVNEFAERLQVLKNKSQAELVDEKRNVINTLERDLVSFQSKKEQIQNLLVNVVDRQGDVQERIFQLEEELVKIQPALDENQAKLENIEAEFEEVNLKLRTEQEQLNGLSSKFNENNIEYFQVKNKVDSLIQEAQFKQSTYDLNQERIERNQIELAETNEAIKGLLSSSDVDDDILVEMYEQKTTQEQQLNEVEKEYYQLRSETDEREKQVRGIQNKREEQDRLIMELQNELNENKIKLNSIKERLAVEFEVDLNSIINQDHPNEDFAKMAIEVLEVKIGKVKDKLDRIGPINPMAMEAYGEIQQRHEFICTQKADLESAKESLLETIAEIDAAAKISFMEAFTQIKKNFQQVFKTLFTEDDTCDLQLTDEENVLESGIKIMAKPKGKRPLTISQLSGGEKTLTATSLLFAIYLLKPAPFCIFDEVDAPLDDANIDKFNNIIKEFSKDSQFIIVTHNKRTMSTVDVIYGITMQEVGVSRVVPVDFRTLQKMA